MKKIFLFILFFYGSVTLVASEVKLVTKTKTNVQSQAHNKSQKKTRTLSQLKSETNKTLAFKIVYGDQESHFSIKEVKNQATVEFSNNFGRKESRSIKSNDFKFLMRETNLYKGQNSKELCKRHYIEFETNKRKHTACIGSSTPIAKQLTQTTGLLSLLF